MNETYMDDWALTAIKLGLCNSDAYLALAEGRSVTDYAVPGILDAVIDPNGIEAPKLIISNNEKFKEYFVCGDNTNTSKVMYIPGNAREGEPLHLYRRLEMLRKLLVNQKPKEGSPEQAIINEISTILRDVHGKVQNKKGYY